MNPIERLRQYLGKASFSSESDRYSALECVSEIERGRGWQPIATYDALQKKPKHAAFLFAGTPPARGQLGKYGLPPTIVLTRAFGCRVCTMWIEIPEPEEQA